MMEETASEAIRSLIARIAHTADEESVEEYAQLYTEDAVWEMTGTTQAGATPQICTGLAEIMAAVRERRATGIAGPGTATRHVTSCVAVSIESEDTAQAESVWQFYADTTTSPRLSGMGRYHDVLRRVGGRWLLARRSISVG
ncbi:nuclear transport factor 2 family protein [Rhodococcus daqingensis]|uniref:Nuclear transport factor 2 family protein n=1 Tax=Rhodococcus daqingensis TaxID=2479363 RepID=A0ABW2RTB9_9NOCA